MSRWEDDNPRAQVLSGRYYPKPWHDHKEFCQWCDNDHEHPHHGCPCDCHAHNYQRNMRGIAVDETLGSLECWCGEERNHDWPGRASGAPHPTVKGKK